VTEVESAIDYVKRLTVPNKGLLHEHLVNEYESTQKSLSEKSWATQLFLGAIKNALNAKAERPFQAINLMRFYRW